MSLSSVTGVDPVKVRQLSWLLFFRIVIIFIFLGGTLLYSFREDVHWVGFGPQPLFILAALSFVHALLSALLLRRTRRLKLFVHFQIVWDQLFTISLIHFSGGIQSFFSFVFILLIVGYSFFLERRELLLCASGSVILFGSLLDLQYYGYLWVPDGYSLDGVPLAEVVYSVFVNVAAYYITALLSGALVARLRRSEHDLQRKTIDYKELEGLNRIILSNIGSGLILINREGRIRLFNAAAESITHYCLRDVYDYPLADLFPEMDVFDGGFKVVKRGDCRIRSKKDESCHLGYSSTLIKTPGDQRLNLLITFQDLTELKVAEERLQQADRLAAIGQLASGLAHEIRNPLASISGAIQLLLENSTISETDARLMQITKREVRRLNSLLTDFLLYARPSLPRIECVGSQEIAESLLALTRSDLRFEDVEIKHDNDSRARFYCDRDKIRQALWNLFLNAAEAMDFHGQINLVFDQNHNQIMVEDNGPGIPDSHLDKIFEPFYSTKDAGTGLGLATVFSIVSAHDGSLRFENRAEGGARFVMKFPSSAPVEINCEHS